MNLLYLTINELNNNGKTHHDILWLSLDNKRFYWEDFIKLADRDYKTVEINDTLQIVGYDFIMNWTKNEIEGGWWFMEVLPQKPDVYEIPVTLKMV